MASMVRVQTATDVIDASLPGLQRADGEATGEAGNERAVLGPQQTPEMPWNSAAREAGVRVLHPTGISSRA